MLKRALITRLLLACGKRLDAAEAGLIAAWIIRPTD
jgi:hypothetical protein